MTLATCWDEIHRDLPTDPPKRSVMRDLVAASEWLRRLVGI